MMLRHSFELLVPQMNTLRRVHRAELAKLRLPRPGDPLCPHQRRDLPVQRRPAVILFEDDAQKLYLERRALAIHERIL